MPLPGQVTVLQWQDAHDYKARKKKKNQRFLTAINQSVHCEQLQWWCFPFQL